MTRVLTAITRAATSMSLCRNPSCCADPQPFSASSVLKNRSRNRSHTASAATGCCSSSVAGRHLSAHIRTRRARSGREPKCANNGRHEPPREPRRWPNSGCRSPIDLLRARQVSGLTGAGAPRSRRERRPRHASRQISVAAGGLLATSADVPPNCRDLLVRFQRAWQSIGGVPQDVL